MTAHRLQLLPQPALPQVPGSRSQGMACRPRSRAAARAIPSRGVHAAGADHRHRLPEQSRDLRHSVQSLCRGPDHHRGRSQAPWRPHRRHFRAAHLGLSDDASPARPHDRAGPRPLAGWRALGVVPARVLPAGACALPPVPPTVPGEARRRTAGLLHFFGQHAPLASSNAFAAYLRPLRKIEWVVYSKRPFGGPEAVLAYLSRYTHRVAIANSRLIAFDDNGVTFKWKDYRTEGRQRQKVMPGMARKQTRHGGGMAGPLCATRRHSGDLVGSRCFVAQFGLDQGAELANIPAAAVRNERFDALIEPARRRAAA
jgi:hypothetical protein